MKNYVYFTALTLSALLFTSALAANISVKDLPDEGVVTLHGIVEDVDNEREFTLRDETGTIDIDIESTQSVTLKKGDQVTLTGRVDKGITGTDINATSVTVDKPLTEKMSDAVKGIPGLSTTQAQAFNISGLPDQGMVKVTGVVSDVDNEKEFTIKDSTGSINVDVESAESAVLTEGAEVTVIGLVDKGLTGKDINASQVIVNSSATPKADK